MPLRTLLRLSLKNLKTQVTSENIQLSARSLTRLFGRFFQLFFGKVMEQLVKDFMRLINRSSCQMQIFTIILFYVLKTCPRSLRSYEKKKSVLYIHKS